LWELPNSYIQGPFIFTRHHHWGERGVARPPSSVAYDVVCGAEDCGMVRRFNVATYYSTHFPLIFIILMGAGVILGAIASVFAIRRYLTV